MRLGCEGFASEFRVQGLGFAPIFRKDAAEVAADLIVVAGSC